MPLKIKSISRLTIIFILAVVLSGSILTWFSINNISNLKELTEKRILEEQRKLSARFSAAIQENINKVTACINKEIKLVGALMDSMNKTTAGNDFIIQPFILKKNGEFLYPNFTGIPENQPEAKYSDRFRSALSSGENAEFAEKNPEKAKGFYFSCLYYSTGSSDSVKTLNALGRILTKLNDKNKAITYYNSIFSDYFALTDENGIPYSCYALPQLLKITDPENREKILPAVVSFLEETDSGKIPLNFNTEDLLMNVTEWLRENTIDNPEK